MDSGKKHKVIRWLNIFLLVINLSAFTTILFLNKQNNITSNENKKFSSDEFIRKKLKLNDKQFKEVSTLDNNVFRSYQLLIDMHCETNFDLLDELSSEHPSKVRLDSLANRIGKMKAAITRQTIRHFLNIKKICNPEQKVLLQKLLQEMLAVGKECPYCNKRECSRRDRLLNK